MSVATDPDRPYASSVRRLPGPPPTTSGLDKINRGPILSKEGDRGTGSNLLGSSGGLSSEQEEKPEGAESHPLRDDDPPYLPMTAGGVPPGYGGFTPQAVQDLHRIIDRAVQLNQQAFAQALVTHQSMLTQRAYVDAAIDRQPNPVHRSQLRQLFSAALIREQFKQARQRDEAMPSQETTLPSGSGTSAMDPVQSGRYITKEDFLREIPESGKEARPAGAETRPPEDDDPPYPPHDILIR